MKIKYINLDISVDKKHRMQQELRRHSLDQVSACFPGVRAQESLNRMSLSETGCLLAHLALLKSCSPDKSTIVLEDDILLSDSFGRKAGMFVDELESSAHDFLLLGQTVVPQDVSTHMKLLNVLKETKEDGRHAILSAANFYRFGAFAYIVNRKSVEKIKSVLENTDLTKNAKPFDIMMGQWFREGIFSGGIIFPYVVGIDSGLESVMFDRANSNDHALYARLVNMYLDGLDPDPVDSWMQIVENKPNPHALEICKSIYLRLTR